MPWAVAFLFLCKSAPVSRPWQLSLKPEKQSSPPEVTALRVIPGLLTGVSVRRGRGAPFRGDTSLAVFGAILSFLNDCISPWEWVEFLKFKSLKELSCHSQGGGYLTLTLQALKTLAFLLPSAPFALVRSFPFLISRPPQCYPPVFTFNCLVNPDALL